MIPAEPLEAEVMTRLREVVNDLGGLRERALALARQQLLSAASQADQRDGLVEERQRIEETLSFIIDNYHGAARKTAGAKAQELQDRLVAIERRVELIDAVQMPGDKDVESVADAVVEQVRALSDGLSTGCNYSIRKLVRLLVGRLVVDLDTKALEMELRLPNWSVAKGVRLEHALACENSDEENDIGGLVLGKFRCEYRKRRNGRCFTCCPARQAA